MVGETGRDSGVLNRPIRGGEEGRERLSAAEIERRLASEEDLKKRVKRVR